MSNRAQLDHGLIDVDFLHKPKIIAFRSRFGHAAVTFIIEIILQCSRSTDGHIDGDTFAGLIKMFDLPDGHKMLEYCLVHEILSRDDLGITNKRVLEDQEKLFIRREKDRERQRKKRDNAVTKGVTAPVTRGVTPDTDTDTGSEDLDLKELSPDLRIAIPKWIEHRAVKKKPLGFTEIDAIKLEGLRDPEGLLRSIRASLKNGHETLYAVAEEKTAEKSGKSQHFEKVIALVKRHGRAGWESAKGEIPPDVLPAVKSIGWNAFCSAPENDLKLRTRFFEALK